MNFEGDTSNQSTQRSSCVQTDSSQGTLRGGIRPPAFTATMPRDPNGVQGQGFHGALRTRRSQEIFFLSFFLFFFSQLHLQQAEVPGLGIEPTPQL